MPQLVTAAILNQQVPTDQIRQTGTVLEAIVSGHRATWSELGACQEIADLLKRSAILERDAHQAGNHVVEPDQFRRAIRTFEPQEDFCGVRVVMYAEVESALSGNPDFLRDVVTTVGEGASADHAASTTNSMLKLRGCSLLAPLFDGSRWGHQYLRVFRKIT